MKIFHNNPIVSIIVPVYNVSAYIGRCVESIVSQTYEGIEFIFVDDASQDNSIEICEEIRATHDIQVSFNVVHHERNRGLSAARNTGIDAATGDYIFFLDSDDEISGDCIDKLVTPVLKDDTIEMVMGNWEQYPEGKKDASILRQWVKLPEQDLNTSTGIRDLCFSKRVYPMGAWNKLIKRSFLIENKLYFKEGLLWEDHLWNFFVLKHLRHMYIISDVTYYYYVHPFSIVTSTAQEEKNRNFGVIYETIANNLTKGEEVREVKYYFRMFRGMFLQSPKNPAYMRTAKLFKKALGKERLSFVRNQLAVMISMYSTQLGTWLLSSVAKVRWRMKNAIL